MDFFLQVYTTPKFPLLIYNTYNYVWHLKTKIEQVYNTCRYVDIPTVLHINADNKFGAT